MQRDCRCSEQCAFYVSGFCGRCCYCYSIAVVEQDTCWCAEFTDALCPTQWVVAEGKLQLKGEIEAASKAEKLEWKPQEEQIDAFGNVVKIKVSSCRVLPHVASCKVTTLVPLCNH